MVNYLLAALSLAERLLAALTYSTTKTPALFRQVDQAAPIADAYNGV
ncbi:hypothetical protein VC273_10975 [Xanthomonas nasturtii]|nr:hypothetical protein [Xanthomonas nasturtii]MEA9556415.1 hypothetical protein [Xanthomonas nasturtii]